jgi:hypothetical protein
VKLTTGPRELWAISDVSCDSPRLVGAKLHHAVICRAIQGMLMLDGPSCHECNWSRNGGFAEPVV